MYRYEKIGVSAANVYIPKNEHCSYSVSWRQVALLQAEFQLPVSNHKQHDYNLRDRSHNFELINKNAHLNDRHFIVRQLYKDSYWLLRSYNFSYWLYVVFLIFFQL